jgi:hypothetical protein
LGNLRPKNIESEKVVHEFPKLRLVLIEHLCD